MASVKLRPGIILRSGAKALSGLLVMGLVCSAASAQTQYRVAAGDVLEISIARIPELQRRVPIDIDGSISFPPLGTVVVAGLTPAEAQVKIQALLASKTFQTRTADGRSNVVVISPEEVIATVSEYRPVYVNGDVSKPGAYAYRPLMTARQVIALAGGYDTVHFRPGDPILDLADLKSERESLWIEFAKERVHAWRLQAELGESDSAKQSPLAGVPLPDSQLSEIVKRETALLSADQTDRQREREFIQSAITQGSDQMATLSEQQQAEEQGVKSDTEELEKDLDLLKKGTVLGQRVTDARRAVLLSSTRKLQTVVQLMQLKKQQNELQRKLEQLDDRRQIELLGEMQEVNAKLNEIRAKLQGVDEKIQYTGLLRSRLISDGTGGPEIAIVRMSANGSQRFVAADDAEVQPGDVVEVALRRNAAAAATH
jgi:polysaccharide export outer membrane protein